MPLIRDTFCSYCGARHAETAAYPRTCGSCKTTIWANPIPVSVVLVPVIDAAGDDAAGGAARTGLLVVRRAIEPRAGKLALVGGFLEEHETWQQGGAREVREETGAVIDATALTPLWFASSAPRPSRVLLFSVAPALPVAALPPYVRDAETSERGLVFGPGGLDEAFAFPLHVEAARRFFAAHAVTGDHGFTPR